MFGFEKKNHQVAWPKFELINLNVSTGARPPLVSNIVFQGFIFPKKRKPPLKGPKDVRLACSKCDAILTWKKGKCKKRIKKKRKTILNSSCSNISSQIRKVIKDLLGINVGCTVLSISEWTNPVLWSKWPIFCLA